MVVTAARRLRMTATVVGLALAASASVHAQTSSATPAPSEPLDAAGNPCGALRALPADVTQYRYEASNGCDRPVSFFWRCSAADAEHSLDIPGKGAQSTSCLKAAGAAGEIVFRFGPPGTGN
ncbi:hypothetical protein PCE31106_04397 [Pandoraea cepalis]|uniref:Uncharacterized protein n=2 Tax=Burkholderiaceae TaxID=119060 RepID=A0A5E4YCT9_9BURK|nr:hypothetical protein PCE31106_04397 [Pandoraea cepalis]